MTTENAVEPVVLDGTAEIVADAPVLARVIGLMNDTYATDYSVDFLDPSVNATVCVRPRWAFGLVEEDFTGSPTRWRFGGGA